jgi:hypothetical protein
MISGGLVMGYIGRVLIPQLLSLVEGVIKCLLYQTLKVILSSIFWVVVEAIILECLRI